MVVLDILKGLNIFYYFGKIYCDLKLENVFFDDVGKVKFIDFGIVGYFNIQFMVVNSEI